MRCSAKATALICRCCHGRANDRYLIGHKFGSWLLTRYGHYVGVTTGRIKLGQYLFLRYGGKIIFFAQFVPVLRTLAGPFAGANLMPWRKFMFANAVSSFNVF